ncbi:unnamed protein product, partial [Trichogramma brassicae]
MLYSGKNEDRQISTTIQENLNSLWPKARHSALKRCPAQLISGIDLHHLLHIVALRTRIYHSRSSPLNRSWENIPVRDSIARVPISPLSSLQSTSCPGINLGGCPFVSQYEQDRLEKRVALLESYDTTIRRPLRKLRLAVRTSSSTCSMFFTFQRVNRQSNLLPRPIRIIDTVLTPTTLSTRLRSSFCKQSTAPTELNTRTSKSLDRFVASFTICKQQRVTTASRRRNSQELVAANARTRVDVLWPAAERRLPLLGRAPRLYRKRERADWPSAQGGDACCCVRRLGGDVCSCARRLRGDARRGLSFQAMKLYRVIDFLDAALSFYRRAAVSRAWKMECAIAQSCWLWSSCTVKLEELFLRRLETIRPWVYKAVPTPGCSLGVYNEDRECKTGSQEDKAPGAHHVLLLLLLLQLNKKPPAVYQTAPRTIRSTHLILRLTIYTLYALLCIHVPAFLAGKFFHVLRDARRAMTRGYFFNDYFTFQKKSGAEMFQTRWTKQNQSKSLFEQNGSRACKHYRFIPREVSIHDYPFAKGECSGGPAKHGHVLSIFLSTIALALASSESANYEGFEKYYYEKPEATQESANFFMPLAYLPPPASTANGVLAIPTTTSATSSTYLPPTTTTTTERPTSSSIRLPTSSDSHNFLLPPFEYVPEKYFIPLQTYVKPKYVGLVTSTTQSSTHLPSTSTTTKRPIQVTSTTTTTQRPIQVPSTTTTTKRPIQVPSTTETISSTHKPSTTTTTTTTTTTLPSTTDAPSKSYVPPQVYLQTKGNVDSLLPPKETHVSQTHAPSVTTTTPSSTHKPLPLPTFSTVSQTNPPTTTTGEPIPHQSKVRRPVNRYHSTQYETDYTVSYSHQNSDLPTVYNYDYNEENLASSTE